MATPTGMPEPGIHRFAVRTLPFYLHREYYGWDMPIGNYLFLLGAFLEMLGLYSGVNSVAVALSMIAYGVVLLITGYLDY